MKGKILAMFLALTLTAGMTMTVCAEGLPADGNVVATDGGNHDYSGKGQATSVVATDGSEVTVDRVKIDNVPASDEPQSGAVTGMQATIHVKGNVEASGTKGVVGAMLMGADADIHGDVIVTASGDNAVGLCVLGVNDTLTNSTAIVDGDVKVTGHDKVIGLGVVGQQGDKSKAYIKGDLTVEGDDNVIGVESNQNSITIIDGTVSVTATGGTAQVVEGANNGASGQVYVYKVVGNAVLPESSKNTQLFYIIKAQNGVNVSGTRAFSDEELGTSFDYACAGEDLIVSSKSGRIGEIRNADEDVALEATDNGDGTWTVKVPDRGGVNLRVIMAVIDSLSKHSSDSDDDSESSQDDAFAANKVTFAQAVTNAAALSVGTTVVVPGVGAISVSENEVNIVTPGCGSFNKAMVDSLSNFTKDLVITYSYAGHTYQFAIPAGVNLNQFLNEEGYAGYLYLSEMFGRYEIIDGEPVLVIPAKASFYAHE